MGEMKRGVRLRSESETSQTDELTHLIDAMRDLGVSARIAGHIAAEYDPVYLWQKVRQTRYARRVGVATNPAGWFVSSVRNNWKPPSGFDEWAEMAPEEYQEALFKSWGICRLCWSRPCRCMSGGQGEGVEHEKFE